MSDWWESAPLAPADDRSFTGYIPGQPKDPLAQRGKELDVQLKEKQLTKSDTTPEAKATEETAAGYLARMVNANSLYGQGIEPRGALTQTVVDHLPRGVVNEFSSPERRAAQNYADDFIRAKLRRESGAVIGEDEMKREYELYFPMSGDVKADIDRKQHLRDQAIESMRVAAGASADKVKIVGGGTTATLGDKPEVGVSGLSDEQTRAYQAFLAAHNGKPEVGQLKTFLEGLTGKTVVNADKIAASLAAGQPANTTVEDRTYKQKIQDRIGSENKLGLGGSPAETLVNQGATLALSDEAGGVGNAAANIISSAVGGKFDPVGSYKFGRDVERQRIEEARGQLGWGGTALEVAGGLASASPANALAAFSPRAATAAAATGGALAGWGSGEGTRDSLIRGGVGAAGGAAIQHVLPSAVERTFRVGGRGMAPDVARASEAEGVDLIRPMVDPHTRSDFGALESNIYSQPTIRGATARVRGQIEDRVENLGAGGTPLDAEAAGSTIQGAGRRFIERSRNVANTLYNRARSLSEGATVTPRVALTQLRSELQALNETPSVNQGEIAFIDELGNDLTSGPLSVDAIRNLRASVRGRINQSGLTATQADARATRILDALQQDVQASLPQGAAQAFRRADGFYRERMTHIDDIVSRFLGRPDNPISGEQAFTRLKGMTNPGGDSRRLAGLMRSLAPDERQDIAATMAQSLGRRAPDEPFSTALFLSQARKLSTSARRTIFGEGGAESIENLRLLSQRLEESEQDINRSRSATVLERQGIRTAARSFIAAIAGLGGQAATGSLAGGLAGAGVAVAAMGASAARRVLSARAMVNPRVSRWLAQSVDVSTPQQAQEAVRRFGLIISREPALANELKPFYDLLNQRVTPRLAADQPEGGDNEQR